MGFWGGVLVANFLIGGTAAFVNSIRNKYIGDELSCEGYKHVNKRKYQSTLKNIVEIIQNIVVCALPGINTIALLSALFISDDFWKKALIENGNYVKRKTRNISDNGFGDGVSDRFIPSVDSRNQKTITRDKNQEPNYLQPNSPQRYYSQPETTSQAMIRDLKKKTNGSYPRR